MTDTPDARFLKLAVSQGHLAVEVAKALYRDAQHAHRSVSDLLRERQLMSNEQIAAVSTAAATAPSVYKRADKLLDQTIGGFQIVGRLGQGGMGTVYRARQLSMDREVALKVLSPDVARKRGFIERFLRETISLGSVNHPNVVSCYDAGQDGNILYMAMELVTGGDADRLARDHGGALSPVRAAMIVRDAAAGLGSIARCGLVHRDIKPANIFLATDGTAKLADLGLARHEDGDDRMTRTGTAMGTPAYMSPEQAMGESTLDIRSDIFSLGATLFSLCTGHPPYHGASPYAVVAHVINDPVPDPRTHVPLLPDALISVIKTAMAKDRGKRYQTPLELQQALIAAIDLMTHAGLGPDDAPPQVKAHNPIHPTPLPAQAGHGAHRPHHHRHEHHPPEDSAGGTSLTGRRAWITGILVLATAAVLVVMIMASTRTAEKITSHHSSAALASTPIAAATPPAAPVTMRATGEATDVFAPLKPGTPWVERQRWADLVAALPSEQRLAPVLRALRELNPNWNGPVIPTLGTDGTTSDLTLGGQHLHDIRPLIALRTLQSLALSGGNAKQRIGFFDLQQVVELRLKSIALHGTMIEDLSAFAAKSAVPPETLDIGGTPITDLTPILTTRLRVLAFTPAGNLRGLDRLRSMDHLDKLGTTLTNAIEPEAFWAALAAQAQTKMTAVESQKTLEKPTIEEPPRATPQLPAPALAEPLPTQPPLRACDIPDNADKAVAALLNDFNRTIIKLDERMLSRRKDADRALSRALDSDYKQALSAAAKNPELLATAVAINASRSLLEPWQDPRNHALAELTLPKASHLAVAEWRGTALPAIDERTHDALAALAMTIDQLRNLPEHPSHEVALMRLVSMQPRPARLAGIGLPPLAGCRWGLDCGPLLTKDIALVDATGQQPTMRGTAPIVETDLGKAVHFDGRGAYSYTTIASALTQYSLMTWINLHHLRQDSEVLALAAADGTRFALRYHGSAIGWMIDASDQLGLTTEEMRWPDGWWIHVAIIGGKDVRRLVINGNEVALRRTGAPAFAANSQLVLGGSEGDRKLSALLDGCLLFDHPLSNDDIKQVMGWQFATALERSRGRISEFTALPLANGGFERSASRPEGWIGRTDGCQIVEEDGSRMVRISLLKAGQESRVLKQIIKIDPTWRSVKLSCRARIIKEFQPAHDDRRWGPWLVLQDPTGQQPDVQRGVIGDQIPPVGTWAHFVNDRAWPIPPGYTQLTVEIVLNGMLGAYDLDDLQLTALAGIP